MPYSHFDYSNNNGFPIEPEVEMEPTKNNPKLIMHMLSCLESPSRDLTKWEEDFVASVTDQFNSRGQLSDKQFVILEKIYAEKTE